MQQSGHQNIISFLFYLLCDTFLPMGKGYF